MICDENLNRQLSFGCGRVRDHYRDSRWSAIEYQRAWNSIIFATKYSTGGGDAQSKGQASSRGLDHQVSLSAVVHYCVRALWYVIGLFVGQCVAGDFYLIAGHRVMAALVAVVGASCGSTTNREYLYGLAWLWILLSPL